MLVLALLLLAGVAGAFLQGRRTALESMESLFDRRSVSRRNLLQRDLQNPLLVPQILAISKTVRSLLARPTAIAAREESELLEETANNTQMDDVIYVMNLDGDCLASSNWREGDSFVGKNYKFRPYFAQALAGQTGRYIAKGVTSAKVGYYLARPVMIEGKVGGVVVTKISFDTLQLRVEDFWRNEDELDLVTDQNGVVVLSPLPAFAFKSMQALPEATRKSIETSRQYGNEILPLAMTPGKVLGEQIRFVGFRDIPGQSFLQRSYSFPELDLPRV